MCDGPSMQRILWELDADRRVQMSLDMHMIATLNSWPQSMVCLCSLPLCHVHCVLYVKCHMASAHGSGRLPSSLLVTVFTSFLFRFLTTFVLVKFTINRNYIKFKTFFKLICTVFVTILANVM